MSLADELNAPPLAHRVADIIKRHAAALELGSDWALAAAVRVLVEVRREDDPANAREDATESALQLSVRLPDEGGSVVNDRLTPDPAS